MPFSLKAILDKQLFLGVSGLLVLGIILDLAGNAVLQSDWDKYTRGLSTVNYFGLNWYLLVYYLSLFAAIFASIGFNTVHVYGNVFVGLIATALAMIFNELNSTVIDPRLLSYASNGFSVKLAGLIFIVIAEFAMMVMVGAPACPVLGLGHSDASSTTTSSSSANPSSANPSDLMAKSGSSSGPRPSVTEMPVVTASSISAAGPTSATPSVASSCPFQAQALFAYKADPKDPNEISFTKDAIMTVTDNNGRWWKVTMKDGGAEVKGIAPSNYLRVL